MKTTAIPFALLLLALSACTRQPTPASDDAALTPESAPAATVAGTESAPASDPRFVFDVQIGNALTPDGKLAATVTDFPPGDTIHVAVTLHGKGDGKLHVELQDAGNAALEAQSTDVTDAAGDDYMLTFAPGDKRMPGTHRILVLLDEKPVWEKPLTFK